MLSLTQNWSLFEDDSNAINATNIAALGLCECFGQAQKGDQTANTYSEQPQPKAGLWLHINSCLVPSEELWPVWDTNTELVQVPSGVASRS